MQVYKYRSALPKDKTLKRLAPEDCLFLKTFSFPKTISLSEDYLFLKTFSLSKDCLFSEDFLIF